MTDEEKAWRLYELLAGSLQLYHSRWVDNFRVFLSFNAILLPASAAVMGFALNSNIQSSLLRIIVVVLALIGIYATWAGRCFMLRIRRDTDLRFGELATLEKQHMGKLPLRPYTMGYKYFLREENLTAADDGMYFSRQGLSRWNRRATQAYGRLSWVIIVAYVLLGVFAVCSRVPNEPARPTYRVRRVVDGDTFEVEDGSGLRTRVRLRRYDAPDKGQPGWAAAKARLTVLIGDQSVTLMSVAPDRHGRAICAVYVDGQDVGEAMRGQGKAR